MIGFSISIGLSAQNVTSGGGAAYQLPTTGLEAAYSSRKLVAAYAGNALQLRQESGSSTNNIGFVGNDFDAATADSSGHGYTGTLSSAAMWV